MNKGELNTRKLDPDEIPLQPMAQTDNGSIALKCRTPEEAFLVCDELEKLDILAILPNEKEFFSEFELKGYVEVKVSAKAYGPLTDLRASVEFQYKLVRAEQPLSYFGRLLSVGSGLFMPPGLLIFIWLLTSYKKNGYLRMKRDLKFWFSVGVISWFLLLIASIVLFPHGDR